MIDMLDYNDIKSGFSIKQYPIQSLCKTLRAEFSYLTAEERVIYCSCLLCGFREVARELHRHHNDVVRVYDRARLKVDKRKRSVPEK